MNATWLWPLWQAVVLSLAWGFTRRGTQRFVQWGTGLALNAEEHTITQSLVALDRVHDGKPPEAFAEYGSWNLPHLQWGVARRLDRLPGRVWHGYRVWAGDDTKVHRTSRDVWGTCTFHEYTARCPNRASTVRAHNWVVLGVPCPAKASPPTSCRSPAACTAARRSSPPPRTGRRSSSGPSASCSSRWGGSTPTPARASVRRVRRRVRLAERGSATGGARRAGPTAGRRPDPPAARRPAARPAASGASAGPAGGDAEVGGKPLAAAAARGPVARGLANGDGVPVRPAPPGRVQGGGVPVAGARPRRGRQGRRRRGEGYRKRFTLVTSATDLSGVQMLELFCAGSGRRTPSAT